MESVTQPLVKVREGAAFLKISKDCLYRKIGAGEIPVYRIGRALRIDLNEVKEWARRNGKT
jgi:excisionase family DNA binding protein